MMSEDHWVREIEQAKEMLRAPVEVDAARRTRLWAHIDEGRTRKRRQSFWLGGFGFATCAALMAVLWVGPRYSSSERGPVEGPIQMAKGQLTPASGAENPAMGRAIPEGVPFRASTAAQVAWEAGQVTLAPNTVWTLTELRTVSLETGKLDVQTDASMLVVRTDEMRVQTLAGRFSVERTPDRTLVLVESGKVRVKKRGAIAFSTLTAGQTMEIDRAPVTEAPGNAAPDVSASAPTAPASAPRAAPRRVPRSASPAALPNPDVRAWMQEADALRRAGRASEAIHLYGRVMTHPDGGPYLEEAMLHQATVRFQTKDLEGALGGLERARSLGRTAPLAPERTALEANILLHQGRLREAAQRLKGAGTAVVVHQARLRVAERLMSVDVAQARILLTPVLDAAPDLAEAARKILSGARSDFPQKK